MTDCYHYNPGYPWKVLASQGWTPNRTLSLPVSIKVSTWKGFPLDPPKTASLPQTFSGQVSKDILFPKQRQSLHPCWSLALVLQRGTQLTRTGRVARKPKHQSTVYTGKVKIPIPVVETWSPTLQMARCLKSGLWMAIVTIGLVASGGTWRQSGPSGTPNLIRAIVWRCLVRWGWVWDMWLWQK